VLHLINAPDSSETRHASGVLFAVRIIVHARDLRFFHCSWMENSVLIFHFINNLTWQVQWVL